MNAEDALLARKEKPKKRDRQEDAWQDRGWKTTRTRDRWEDKHSKLSTGRCVKFHLANCPDRSGPDAD